MAHGPSVAQWFTTAQHLPPRSVSTRGGTRTRNLLLRREAPYPLGHTSCYKLLATFGFGWIVQLTMYSFVVAELDRAREGTKIRTQASLHVKHMSYHAAIFC